MPPHPCARHSGVLIPRGARCPLCRRENEARRPRRTRQQRGLGAEHERVTKQAIARDRVCVDCGHPGSRDNPLTGDHIVPRARGGETTLANYATRCRVCNARKGAR